MKELSSILKNIKNKELQPLYFFHGKEPFFIDAAIKSFENDILSVDEKAFGQTVVYGKDTTVQEIISLAQQFPMFGDLNLIIVKEAKDLKIGEEERNLLENYANNPVMTTVLVFAYKYDTLNGNTKLAKSLKSKGMLFQSDEIKDNNLANWITDYCRDRKIPIAPNIARLLADYLGNDLSKVANELEKVKIIMREGEVLDGALVEKHIGISKDFNIYELITALARKDADRSMKIAFYMGKNEKSHPFVLSIANLYSFFSNLVIALAISAKDPQSIQSRVGANYYQAQDLAFATRNYSLKNATRIISVLREMDLKQKGLGAVNQSAEELYREMIYKILNVDKLKVKT